MKEKNSIIKIVEKTKTPPKQEEAIKMIEGECSRKTAFKKIGEAVNKRELVKAVGMSGGRKETHPTTLISPKKHNRIIRFTPIIAGGTADSFCFNTYDEVNGQNILTTTLTGFIEIDKFLFESGRTKII